MDPLKPVVQNLDEVPEPLRGFYAKDEKSGQHILQVDVEAHPSVRGLKNAHEATKEAKRKAEEEFRAKYGDLDPELARKLIEDHQKQQDKKLLEAGEVDKLLEQRTEKMRKEHEKALKSLQDELGLSNKQLEKLLIENAVQTAATKAGVRSTAIDDVLLRAKQLFRVQNGTAIPFNGDAVVYGKNGSTPLTPEEWLEELSQKAPHLFNDPKGMGTQPGSGAANSSAGSHRISRADAKDVQKYRAAREAAAKLGVQLEIID